LPIFYVGGPPDGPNKSTKIRTFSLQVMIGIDIQRGCLTFHNTQLAETFLVLVKLFWPAPKNIGSSKLSLDGPWHRAQRAHARIAARAANIRVFAVVQVRPEYTVYEKGDGWIKRRIECSAEHSGCV
jgi:hypothetical protein